MVRAYRPVLAQLSGLLTGEKLYGTDVVRQMHFHNLGFGHLGRQFPFRVVTQMLEEVGAGSVLDLRCGYGDFLLFACARGRMRGYGVDVDEGFVERARERFEQASLNGSVKVATTAALDAKALADFAGEVDAIVSLDVLHEHVWLSSEKVTGLLAGLREAFPESVLIVGEYFGGGGKVPFSSPNGFLEHELYHALSHQRFLSVQQWRDVFRSAGYGVVKERIVGMLGLAYFALKPGAEAQQQ